MLRLLSLIVLALTLLVSTGCSSSDGSNNNTGGGGGSTTVTTPTDGPGGVNGTAFVTTPTGAAADVFSTIPYSFVVTVTGVTGVGGRFSATLDTSTGTANFDGLSVSFSTLTSIASGVFQSTGTVSGGFTGFGTVTITVTYREDELEIISTFIINVTVPPACTTTMDFFPDTPQIVTAGDPDLDITVTPSPTGGILSIVPSAGFSLVGNILTYAASTAPSTGIVASVVVTYDASTTVNPNCAILSRTYSITVLSPPCTPSLTFGTPTPQDVVTGVGAPNLNIAITVSSTPSGGVLSIAPSTGFSLTGNILTFVASTATVGPKSVDVTYDAFALNPNCGAITRTFVVNVFPSSFTNSTSTPIPNPGAITPSPTITVPATAPLITDTRVLVDITHPFATDLLLRLTAPGTPITSVILITPNLPFVSDMEVVFDDNDLNGLDSTSSALGGFLGSAPLRVPFLSYLTADNITSPTIDLNIFTGLPMSGIWTLEVIDYFSSTTGSGTLNEWSIAFNNDVTDIADPSSLSFTFSSPRAISSCSPTPTAITTAVGLPGGGSFSLGFQSRPSGATYAIGAASGALTCTIIGTTSASDVLEIIYTPLAGARLPTLELFTITYTFTAGGPLNAGTALPAVAGADTCALAPVIVAGQLGMGTTVGMTSSAEGGTCITTRTISPDVYFRYTPPGCATSVAVSTCGTAGFDTKLLVYTATGGCAAPVCVAGNDDGSGCAAFSSFLTFTPTAGITYFIVIEGFSSTPPGSLGTYTMSITES